MNHYEILEVSQSASLSEIKLSFRRKVKLVHPDLNPGKDTRDAFLKLNEAYEVLSDPTTRNLYNLYLKGVPVVTQIEEVSPRERYRAQYVRDRVRRQRERIAYQIAIKQKFYGALRYLNIVAFSVAIILSYDFYFTSSEYSFSPKEVVLGRDDTAIYFDDTFVRVARDFYSEYYRSQSREVTLAFSGLLKIPIRMKLQEFEGHFFVKGNLYVFRNGFSVIMFLFSIVVVGNKKYTDFRLTCGLVASFVLLWVSLLLTGYL